MVKIFSSKVTKAKINFQGATITRNGTVELEKGLNTVYISGITKGMVRESLKIHASGDTKSGNINIVDKKVLMNVKLRSNTGKSSARKKK